MAAAEAYRGGKDFNPEGFTWPKCGKCANVMRLVGLKPHVKHSHMRANAKAVARRSTSQFVAAVCKFRSERMPTALEWFEGTGKASTLFFRQGEARCRT